MGKTIGGVVYDAQGEMHDTRKVLPVPAASSGIMEVFRGSYAARDDKRREAMRPFKERLVELILERGPLQLSGAAKLLGRGRRFKQAKSEQRLRCPTFLGLFDDLATTGGPTDNRIARANAKIRANGAVSLKALS